MSDLNIGPPQERNPLPAILIATALLLVVAVLVFLLNPRKTAEFTVQKVDLAAPHTEFQQLPGASHVIGVPAQSEDDLYVLVALTITDKLRLPIFLGSHSATLTAADGSQQEATLVDPAQFTRLQQILPALAPLLNQPQFGAPLRYQDQISPGTPRLGYVVLLFPNLTEAQWRARKAATITFSLEHQNPQTVTLP